MVQKTKPLAQIKGKKPPLKKDATGAGEPPTTTPAPGADEAAVRKQQQLVLNIFRDTFGAVLSAPDFAATLQAVKQALFDRDFARAFGDDHYLTVYAARYSPTRALCYASILGSIRHHLQPLFVVSSSSAAAGGQDPAASPAVPLLLKVVSIGGGAAETVAFASFLSQSQTPAPLAGDITLADSAAWGSVVASLTASIVVPPPLSKYASAAARAANAPLVAPALFAARFVAQDALALASDEGWDLILGPPAPVANPVLVTLLFTLNELFTSGGIGKTTAFLLGLTTTIPIGSLLLVVDSPGSYSEAALGADAKKRYPMRWLLDRILLGTRAEPVAGRRWAKLESHDSVWFRFATDVLDYPIPLENMRYQMHLYKAEDAIGPGDCE